MAPRLLLPTLALFLALLPPARSHCTRSAHCATGIPSRVDLCARPHGLCLSLPHPAARQDDAAAPAFDLVQRTLEDLVNQTDALDFPLQQKLNTIRAVKRVYHGINPHKFLHENLLGVDFPAALDAIPVDSDTSNTEFFVQMERAFQLMDDKHSVYILPYPFNSSIAVLGFETKIFFDRDSNQPTKRRYVVTDFPENLRPNSSTFGPASEILTYGGVPIDDAVRALGERSYASNDAARIDTGLALLTFRILMGEPIPFEKTVDVGYINPNGKESIVTLTWLFAEIVQEEMMDAMTRRFIPGIPGRIRKSKPTARIPMKKKPRLGPKMLSSNVRVVEEGRLPIPIDPAFQARFRAEVISTSNGPIGRFVLPDFQSEAKPELVAELTRVFGLMPKNGMIMDLRGNGGGMPDYVKILVELVSGVTPPQSPVSLRATKLLKDSFAAINMTEFTKQENDTISAFRGAIGTAFEVGEQFTGPTNGLYSSAVTNLTVSRAYFGPVVTVVDGITYSAGDLYTSLQKDLDLSLVVGVSDNVGAGGASTVEYKTFQEVFPAVLEPINGSFTTSFERFYRAGEKLGTIIENFGVKPDVRYYPTLDDALKNDCDLFEFLSQKLREIKRARMRDEMEPGSTPEILAEPSPEEVIF